jgi:hypothetical protein
VPERAERTTGGARPTSPTPLAGDMETQRANVSELLISNLMQAMQRDLAEAESNFVGPGVAASARGRLGRVMECALAGPPMASKPKPTRSL